MRNKRNSPATFVLAMFFTEHLEVIATETMDSVQDTLDINKHNYH